MHDDVGITAINKAVLQCAFFLKKTIRVDDFATADRKHLILELATCEWLVQLIAKFERRRTCGYNLHILDVIDNQFECQSDVVHFLSLVDYDQLILYPNFIHVSFVSHESNRHYIMKAEGNGRYARISKEVALSLI